MATRSRITRFAVNLILLVAATLLVLLFAFTFIPLIYKTLGFSSSETISVKNEPVTLDKALIAKACTRDEKNCIDQVLLVSGDLDRGTISAIKQLKGSSLQVDTVCFASRGGDKDVAIDIGEWIKKNHLNTCIAEKYLTTDGITMNSPLCASACPYILAMGHKRTALGSNFRIGIHSSGTILNFGLFTYRITALDYMGLGGYKPMLENSGDINSAQHVELLEDSLATPFDELKYLTTAEQKKYALFTENR
jgi:hypothetical protein